MRAVDRACAFSGRRTEEGLRGRDAARVGSGGGGGGGADWADALCTLLLLQALPSSALWGVGWILLQLLGRGKSGTPPAPYWNETVQGGDLLRFCRS